MSDRFDIVRINLKTGEKETLEGGAMVTLRELVAMNDAAYEDDTGYFYVQRTQLEFDGFLIACLGAVRDQVEGVTPENVTSKRMEAHKLGRQNAAMFAKDKRYTLIPVGEVLKNHGVFHCIAE